jgi:hypothetical protein
MGDDIEYKLYATSITVLVIDYRERCIEPGCENLARALLRYADRAGRLLFNLEECNFHARQTLERDVKLGLAIHDARES